MKEKSSLTWRNKGSIQAEWLMSSNSMEIDILERHQWQPLKKIELNNITSCALD